MTLLRVLIPWMIGRAFERVGDDEFMDAVAAKLRTQHVPPKVLRDLDPVLQKLLDGLMKDPTFATMMLKAVGVRDAAIIAGRSKEFKEVMRQAFADEQLMTRASKGIGLGDLMTPARTRRNRTEGPRRGAGDPLELRLQGEDVGRTEQGRGPARRTRGR